MGADIKVILEIAKPGLINEYCLWFGTNPNQGIAITVWPSYTLTPLPEKQVHQNMLSSSKLKPPLALRFLPYGRYRGRKKAKERIRF